MPPANVCPHGVRTNRDELGSCAQCEDDYYAEQQASESRAEAAMTAFALGYRPDYRDDQDDDFWAQGRDPHSEYNHP